MKALKSVFPKALMIFLLFTVICGVAYTGIVTGVAQLIFPDKANGSLIEVDGKNMVVNFWDNNIPMKNICGDVL